jgi:hypothetical protein
MNVIQAGSAVPLIWQTLDVSGNPVTNLTLCGSMTGSGCTAPWVFVGTIGVSCTTDAPTSTNPLPDMSAGSSGLQNQGGGLYQFNWKTLKGSTGCVTPVLIFSTGFISFDVAEFKYKK